MLYHQAINSKGNYHYNAYLFKDFRVRPHFHKNLELIYVLEGEVTYTVDERERVLKPGEFALALPNEIHSIAGDQDTVILVTVFSADHVPLFTKQVQGCIGSDFVFRCSESVEKLFRENVMNMTEANGACWGKKPSPSKIYQRNGEIRQKKPPLLILKACLYAVCSEYLRQVELRELKEKRMILSRAIIEYITVHYRDKITLADLARELGYSYHYLSKCFRSMFNQSFADILNSYRLDAAMEMLVETDVDITQVALESGFQSIRSFNEFFKSQLGMTPSKYRSEFAKNRRDNL